MQIVNGYKVATSISLQGDGLILDALMQASRQFNIQSNPLSG